MTMYDDENYEDTTWEAITEKFWTLLCWLMIFGSVFTLPIWTWFVPIIYKRNKNRQPQAAY